MSLSFIEVVGSMGKRNKKYKWVLAFLFAISIQHLLAYTGRNSFTAYREFNAAYKGHNLDHVAFPIGGMGAGMFCLEGTGAISHVSVKNKPDLLNEPYSFAAICVKGLENGAKVLEGPVPNWKLFSQPQSGLGLGDKTYGLPRFDEAVFQARFPFATIDLKDDNMPLKVKITGWSPFIPTDQDNSGLPVGVLEYEFTNIAEQSLEMIFSYNSKNFVDGGGSIKSAHNGFTLVPAKSAGEEGLTIYVDKENAVIDPCWFRGGWFDSQSVLWNNIRTGQIIANSEVDGISPGASIYVPFLLKPGETETIRVNFCWYLPDSDLSCGIARKVGTAFQGKPTRGTAPGQQLVSGFVGNQLLNSFDAAGDGLVGIIESPEFEINRDYLKFLVGGGSLLEQTSVNLVVDGKITLSVAGNQTENLNEIIWDLRAYKGKKAKIRVLDLDIYPWGHILADQFVLTDNKSENLFSPSAKAILLADFEGDDWNGWRIVDSAFEEKKFSIESRQSIECFRPWYAERFRNLQDVVDYWNEHVGILKKNSELFRDAFFSSTLPAEVLEAISANLTILKSPTVLRQWDGKFWAWEGCADQWGSCHGSCTHVWNYAQALPHLFPAMERTLRETEFLVNQNEKGHQNFRANMPISAPSHSFHAAADGQLGGIMQVYRDWRISGDTDWIRHLYPFIKSSLDYCISTWDPNNEGCLREPHHNTYDIEFWGPDGMCTSIYIGALSAFVEISRSLGEPVGKYQDLLAKGKKFLEKELYNGEYFIQHIQWKGLHASDPTEALSFGGTYSNEAVELLQKEGPKYQYGEGCLSDGIIGMWRASVCGLSEVIDNEKVTSHLESVYKYNFKTDLSDHYNPQRPGYACGKEGGLLLCTWPKGGDLSLPFVYSNEVWTGIEYQVASHLMMKGEIDKGLDIVRKCRLRYDGRVRNPFDEYECGNWYARAMSSWAMLQAMTGVRYDAVDKTLYVDSKIGDFKSFISTNTGFGTVEWKDGKVSLKVLYGDIEVEHYNVSGKLLD